MEAVGAAAAILQISTAGTQCALKLVAFAGQMRTAPERITHIAKDVSLSASILQQLGELIRESKGDGTSQQDSSGEEKGRELLETASLATDGSSGQQQTSEQGIFNDCGLETTANLASRCNELFDSLSGSLQNAGQQLESKTRNTGKVKLSLAERLKWPFSKPEMDAVREDLKDAKGTLMLMLQVATLAYSRKVTKCDNTDRNTIIKYSEKDQHFLVRSIVAAHRDRQIPNQGAKASTTIDGFGKTEPVGPSRESESLPKNQDSAMYRGIETTQALSQSDSSEQSVVSQEVINNAVNFDQAGSQPLKRGRPIPSGYHDSSFSRAASKPLYERYSPPRSPEKFEEAELVIRVLSPCASLHMSKIHVEYEAHVIRPSPSVIEAQIQQWKSSQPSLVDQLLQLTSQEQSALDCIDSPVSRFGLTTKETLECIHIGDYFPVIDGLDQVKARVISVITRQWSLISADKSGLKSRSPVREPSREGDYDSDEAPRSYGRSRSRRSRNSSSLAGMGLGRCNVAGAMASIHSDSRRQNRSRSRRRPRQRHIGLVSGDASEDEGNETDDSVNGDDIVQDLMDRYTTLSVV